MSDHDEPKLEVYFASAIVNQPEALKTLSSLCTGFSLNAEELFYQWEAFLFNEKSEPDVKATPDRLAGFRQVLDKERERNRGSSITAQTAEPMQIDGPPSYDVTSVDSLLQVLGVQDTKRKTRPSVTVNNRINPSLRQGKLPAFPSKDARPVEQKPDVNMMNDSSGAAENYKGRENRRRVEDSLNGHLGSFAPTTTAQPSRDIVELEEKRVNPYRYMFDKVGERASVLDQLIEELGEEIRVAYDLEDGFAHPAQTTQSAMYTVGRICCDSDARLNESSVVLEASRDLGGGARVKLHLAEAPNLTLFPGQIVGIKGTNADGQRLVVHEILEPPPLPLWTTPVSGLEGYRQRDASLSRSSITGIMIAAGPYTLEDTLDCDPFKDLLREAASLKPDLLLLLGPFVDREHPLVRSGRAAMPPEEIFRKKILIRLLELRRVCPGVRVALVPASAGAKELCDGGYVGLPQPGLDKRLHGIPEEVLCFSNPAQFRVDETVFAVCTSDILFHLRAEEIDRNASTSDRLGRLAGHLLHQRSLYPLFPAAAGEFVDVGRMAAVRLDRRPDFLIVPSQLKGFVKNVDDAVCVNPGQLAKRRGGGTYARVSIHPVQSDALAGANGGGMGVVHNANRRTKAEIVRI